MKKFINLNNAIFLSMLLGICAGIFFGNKVSALSPLGDFFISLIKMLVIPLVSVSIISGSSSISEAGKSASKIGITTLLIFAVTTIISVILAILAGEIFTPGIGFNLGNMAINNDLASYSKIAGAWETILGFVPTNPVQSFADGNIVQILFFCLFLGFGLSTVEKSKRIYITTALDSLTEAMIWGIKKIMYVAPLGIFALMANSVSEFGSMNLIYLAKLIFLYFVVLLIINFGLFSAMLKLFSKMSCRRFIQKIKEAQIVALSTASSMATLPVNFEICTKELGVKNETASFVLPLGATINMNGNAAYYAMAAIFFAQVFGIELTMTSYAAIIFTATIGAIGQAGVPGPSLLVVATLASAGIPIDGLPILIGVDRIFDMLRTTVNITGDAVTAIIVDEL